MTPSELKYRVERAGRETHFFDRETMRFFGDTMANYGVRRATVISDYGLAGNYCADGVSLDVWELYRKRAVKGGNKASAYFSAETFKRVYERKQP